MKDQLRSCDTCQTTTMGGNCLTCGAVNATCTSPHVDVSVDFLQTQKLRTSGDAGQYGLQVADSWISDNNIGNKSTVGTCDLSLLYGCAGGRSELMEPHSCIYYERLKQVDAERGRLQKKVQAMEEQRVLGTSKIRELIEENKGLRAIIEETEVRLGISEIEQQALLLEVQRLRGSFSFRPQGLGPERQRSEFAYRQAVNVVGSSCSTAISPSTGGWDLSGKTGTSKQVFHFASPGNLGGSARIFSLATEETQQEGNNWQERTEDVGANVYGSGHECERQGLLAMNMHLEARCRVLENQVRCLCEKLVSQDPSVSLTISNKDHPIV